MEGAQCAEALGCQQLQQRRLAHQGLERQLGVGAQGVDLEPVAFADRFLAVHAFRQQLVAQGRRQPEQARVLGEETRRQAAQGCQQIGAMDVF